MLVFHCICTAIGLVFSVFYGMLIWNMSKEIIENLFDLQMLRLLKIYSFFAVVFTVIHINAIFDSTIASIFLPISILLIFILIFFGCKNEI
jgi:hypothetical protein